MSRCVIFVIVGGYLKENLRYSCLPNESWSLVLSHTEKSFSTNLLNRTEIRLYLPLFDRLGTDRLGPNRSEKGKYNLILV